MSEISHNFITKFHNLQGVTVKERHQNLFKLLQENQGVLWKHPTELEFVASNLAPTTHLEQILRIDVLIYFKCFGHLYEEYKNGDEVALCKLARKNWFFQEALERFGGSHFVTAVLPTLPYNVRLKLLRRLPTDEQQSDEVFDALLQKFGLYLATIVLPKCTAVKIDAVFKSHHIILTTRQLKIVCDKEPLLMLAYVEERQKHEGNTSFLSNNPICVHLAQKHPQIFDSLFNKYKFRVQLGRRTTKQFINSQKTGVLDKSEAYVNILKKAPLVRKLGTELKPLLFERSSNGALFWPALLQFYPKRHQFSIYKSLYDQTYHRKFGTNCDDVTDQELQIIPLLERQQLVIKKLDKEENLHYLKYTTPDYGYKIFLDKLANMAAADRARYVQILTECCVLNSDTTNILKLLQLVNNRFKNDDKRIRQALFAQLADTTFLAKLGEAHWKLLTEILATVEAKDEWVCNDNVIKSMYVQYLINSGRPVKDLIMNERRWVHDQMSWLAPSTVKTILTTMLDTGFDEKINEASPAELDCALAHTCKLYNEKNPKNTIDVHANPRVLEAATRILNDENEYISHQCKQGIAYLITGPNSPQLVQLRSLYFNKFKKCGELATCIWALKHEPTVLCQHFDEFLRDFAKVLGTKQGKLWRSIKQYSHLSLDKRTADFCNSNKKKEWVEALSIVAPQAYLEWVHACEPRSSKVDLTIDNVKDLYLLQCQLIAHLHLTKSPDILPTVLKFCTGDYLQSALRALYSAIYKSPDDVTKQVINELRGNRALSVKKHAMHLTCIVCEQNTVHDCLKTATVPSLMPTLKYFVNNPSDKLWELLEAKLANCDKSDLDVLKWAVDLKLPVRYRTRFVEVVWRVLDKYDHKQLKNMWIRKFDEVTIKGLSQEFADELLERNLFKIEEANYLVARLLIHGRTTKFAKILQDFKNNEWSLKTGSKLNRFISELFAVYEGLDAHFVAEFESVFTANFSVCEAFEAWVMVSSLKLKSQSMETCSKGLIELRKVVDKQHGRVAACLLAEAVETNVVPHLFNTNPERIQLCHKLLKFKECVDDYWLIVKVLPRNEPEDIQHFAMYCEILDHLEQVTDDTVRIMLNSSRVK